MGFSGGGSNILKAHTHDGTVSQDGGSLNADNITQMGMAAGDVMYSDGTHLQILNLGSATDTLTVNGAATAPEWAAAAAGSVGLSLIDNTVLGADATDIDTSFAALTQGTDMSGILAIFNGARSDTNGLYLNVNNITATNYSYQTVVIDGGAATYRNESSQNVWEPYMWGNGSHGIKISMIITASDPTIAVAGSQTLQFTSFAIDSGNAISLTGGLNLTAGQTSLSRVKLSAPSGTILEGSQLALYKIGV
jgi:hypothetical protein